MISYCILLNDYKCPKCRSKASILKTNNNIEKNICLNCGDYMFIDFGNKSRDNTDNRYRQINIDKKIFNFLEKFVLNL